MSMHGVDVDELLSVLCGEKDFSGDYLSPHWNLRSELLDYIDYLSVIRSVSSSDIVEAMVISYFNVQEFLGEN